MKSPELITKSCLCIQDVSCYDMLNDFSGPIVTILVAFFSVRFAFKQLDKQHQNTLSAQKEEAKRNTQIELFKEINLLLDTVSAITREVNTFCITKLHPLPGTTIELSHIEYENLSSQLNKGLLSVVSKIESHEIINPKLFKTFRYSLQSVVHDVMQLRFNTDRKAVLDELFILSGDAGCYLYDFQICMQNLAYGDVFKSKLEERVPPNKKLKVITSNSEKLDELLHYFTHESAWGKHCKQQEDEANKKYSS